MIFCQRCGEPVDCSKCEYFSKCTTRRANESTEHHRSRIDYCLCEHCAALES
ncbi:MAG: hypothetical protein ACE5Z5_09305 [Candidatus Bathyarchaeia archaeon]